MSTASYTPEQLARRNASVWTKVQAVLAPIQFIAFIISFSLVIRYLTTGEGFVVANISVVIKILLLWLITVTGMFWEKDVFDQWFLAPEFYWEDVGNAVAMFFHNLYFVAIWIGWSADAVMMLMLVAYTTYLVNCGQFVVRGIRSRKQVTAESHG